VPSTDFRIPDDLQTRICGSFCVRRRSKAGGRNFAGAHNARRTPVPGNCSWRAVFAPNRARSTSGPGGAPSAPGGAFGAPANDASTRTVKHPKHGNDRRFYFPDLLRAACHFCDHLPGNTPLQEVVTRFPIHADGRLAVPEREAAMYLQDLDKNWTPKGLHRRRQGRARVVSAGTAYLVRQTLALLRDSIPRRWPPPPEATGRKEQALSPVTEGTPSTHWSSERRPGMFSCSAPPPTDAPLRNGRLSAVCGEASPSSGARPSSASCATSGPSIGWEDPLADQEETGHDPWGTYGVFEDDDDCAWVFDDNCFCGD